MEQLYKLIANNPDWLIDRVLYYAREKNYVKYTSTLREAWRFSIAGLSSACLEALDNPVHDFELSPDIDYTQNPATYFGIIEAQKHRARGIDLAMYLGLMKYYRQSYIDLIHNAGFELDYSNWCSTFIQRFFDLIEIGICKEWSGIKESKIIEELQTGNRVITNEKNKYLTAFESTPVPIILLNSENQIENINLAASTLLYSSGTPGSNYYGKAQKLSLPAWLKNDLTTFINSNIPENSYEKSIEGKGYFQVKFKCMLDISEKFNGTIVILNDITKQELIEEALAESRDFFLKLLEDFPALIWKSGIDGKCDYFNMKWLEFRGRTIKQEYGDGWFEGVYKDDKDHCMNTYLEAFEKRQPFEIEYRLRRYDGEYRWIIDIGRPYSNIDGNFAGYIGSCYDITEYKEMEIVLNKYRILSERTRDIILFIHHDGHIIEANSAASKAYGYSREELISMTIYNLRGDENLSQGIEKAESSQILFGSIHKCKDGSVFPVEVSSQGIIVGGESIILGIIRDITERKKWEEELKYANQKLMDIIDFLPDATFAVDSDKKIIAWNRAMEEMTGLDKKNIIGKGHCDYATALYGRDIPMLSDFVISGSEPPSDQYENIYWHGKTLYAEGFAPKVFSGKGAYMSATVSPLYDLNGNIVGAIESMRDITSRKNMEEKLKHISMHDHLTGLYNRAYFETEMHLFQENKHINVGLVIGDINGMKHINDTLGHAVGDEALIATAHILRKCFSKESGIVTRIGGDEFAVLITNVSKYDLENSISRVKDAVARYNETNPIPALSISLGYSIRENIYKSMDELFKEADDNMYKDKRNRLENNSVT